MPKFITIGYGNEAGYKRAAENVRKSAHENDAQLLAEGALMGIAGAPVQVRNPEAAQLETIAGPFMAAALPVAGFAIFEAADLADAIQKIANSPCAVAHGVIEVWPLIEPVIQH